MFLFLGPQSRVAEENKKINWQRGKKQKRKQTIASPVEWFLSAKQPLNLANCLRGETDIHTSPAVHEVEAVNREEEVRRASFRHSWVHKIGNEPEKVRLMSSSSFHVSTFVDVLLPFSFRQKLIRLGGSTAAHLRRSAASTKMKPTSYKAGKFLSQWDYRMMSFWGMTLSRTESQPILCQVKPHSFFWRKRIRLLRLDVLHHF